MIPPGKLFQIKSEQRRRKLALCFGALERDILGCAETGCEYHYPSMSRKEYIKALSSIVLKDPLLPAEAAKEISGLMKEEAFDELRLCNSVRNHLLKIIGTLPAEWDLIIAPHGETRDENGNLIKRKFFKDLYVYAEDIRSPFNLGSIFRTAEALGAEKVLLSPFCTDPEHPRAIRSGLGCIEIMPWERVALDDLRSDIPIFVLETGGTPIDEFVFPQSGIVIIGSEELGVSPAALKKATYGRVTIPMKGIKASLNVGVAFGILMNEWVSQLS